LQHILLEAERTSALIEELLSLARADSGPEVLRIAPMSLSTILREVSEPWRELMATRNLTFTLTVAEQDTMVLGDRTALYRLLNILLDNAVKYTPAPGAVEISLEASVASLVIRVSDTGIGIALEDQPKIFERFYRVDKARSRDLGGAGIGLAIAQWIVQQHRGSITVQSALGKGSTFLVELPRPATQMGSPKSSGSLPWTESARGRVYSVKTLRGPSHPLQPCISEYLPSGYLDIPGQVKHAFQAD
jgi:two-component system, OmpR family, sensor histidine kinase CiaH